MKTRTAFLFFATILFTCLVCSFSVQAQTKGEIFHLYPQFEKDFGYAQAVKRGNHIYISGSTGQGKTIEEQIANAYATLKRTLEHFGADFSDVVKETVFVTDMEAMKKAAPARKAVYGNNTPSTSWIGIDRLYSPSAMLEIELVAIVE